jgi:hypothetical protein
VLPRFASVVPLVKYNPELALKNIMIGPGRGGAAARRRRRRAGGTVTGPGAQPSPGARRGRSR